MKKGVSYRIGRFQIIRRIGKGAQGAVFLAKDAYLQRYVAIKALHAGSADQNSLQKSLLQEAGIVGKLKHPNIVPIFEAGESKGIPYLVFEYVHGVSLERLLRKGPLPIPQILKLIQQILRGVACAHRNGVVHRDIKPSNILISKGGVARITDFGISQKLGMNVQNGNVVWGSLPYMAPENFSERPLNPSSDVFSIGLIFYEMLTGRKAVDAENDFAMIYKILYEPSVAPSLMNKDVDKGIDGIALRALQKEQRARYPDAMAMEKDIEAYLGMKKGVMKAPAGKKQTHSTVEFLLRRMRHKTDFPAFSASITEINEKTSLESKSSVSELAHIILKDYALTNKLLKLANSAFYRQAKGGVSGIKQAVILLGYEQIRLAASSLVLFSHIGQGSASTEIRDEMIKSFMSGMIARDVAAREGIKDLEAGFICSMLHNLGKNLTIFYFPEEYAEIKAQVVKDGMDMQRAALNVLGISLDELGVSVAREWKFPEGIVYSMRSLPGGIVERPDSSLDKIRHFSIFANALCEIAGAYRPEQCEGLLDQLVQRFEPSFSLSHAAVLRLLDSAVRKIQRYASILDIDPVESPFIQGVLRFSLFEEVPETDAVEEDGDERAHDLDRMKKKDPVPLPRRVWDVVVGIFNK
ncbi:MAG: protein kinase domain-containing protein [Desulfatiglandales bacterium]